MLKWIAGSVLAVILAVAGYTYLFLDLPEIPRAVLEAKYAMPPSKFVVLADGTRVHYRDRGPRDAPILVLLHGFSGSLFVWEPWSKTLSNQFHVISLDLPGHGLTGAVPSNDYSQAAMTDCLKEFVDKLGLAKFAVAGNSMGGGVAARFAELYPARITHLILIDAAGAQTQSPPRLHLVFMAAQTPVVDRWLMHIVLGHLSELARMKGTRRALLAHFRLPDDTYGWDHVRDIKAPTLILWGKNDHTIAVAAAYAWQNAIPGSKMILYPGAAHVSMADQPEQTARDVREFLTVKHLIPQH